MLSYCLFCSAPTANPHGFCSEQCYDDHAVACEETLNLPVPDLDDTCPNCGPADRCTCSYTPAEPDSWDDDYTIEPYDTDLQCEW